MRVLLGLVLGIVFCENTLCATTTPTTARSPDLFDLNRVWTVHLKVTARQWEMMQPTRGTRLAFLLGVARKDLPTTQPTSQPAAIKSATTSRPTTRQKAAPLEGERMAPVSFGYEYAYVKATAEFDGEVMKEVGLRYKGNGSFNSSNWYRRPMKLNFDHFVPGQTFHGISELNIHISAVDPSYLREALAYQTYRDAGVPAARTAFALVYLTVEGQCDRQYIGLCTLVEDIDKRFLAKHFGQGNGLLLKPDGVRNLPYLGEDWADYGRYRAKSEGTAELRRKLIEFTRFLHYADDETFVGEVRARFNVDGFLRYLAVCTLLSDMDSFLTAAHNFYLYVHPADGRIHLMPWDMHLSFGGSTSDSNPDSAVHLSIEKPYPGMNLLIQRILSIHAYRACYEGYLAEFSRGCFSPEKMARDIERMRTVVAMAEEAARQPIVVNGTTTQPATMPSRPLRPMPELTRYVARRVDSVLGQLAGTVEGWSPGERRPEGPPPPPPPPRMINPPPPVPVRTNRRGEPRPVNRREGAGQAIVPERGRAGGTTREPTLVMRSDRSFVERLLPRQPERRAARRFEVGLPLVMRGMDTDRSNSLMIHEAVDAVRVFYYAAISHGAEDLDAAEIAMAIERMRVILDPTWIAEPGSYGCPPPSEGCEKWAKILLREGDANGDGRVGLGEGIEMVKKLFAKADVSGDGTLSQREFTEALVGMEK